MKKQLGNFALIFLMTTSFITSLFSQNENIWQGGKPGRVSDWNVASNWSKHRVPNEFDNVVVPNTDSSTRTYPFLTGEVTVQSLYIESGAEIVLRDHAMLTIVHWRGRDEGGILRSEPDAHALQITVNQVGEVVAYQGLRK